MIEISIVFLFLLGFGYLFALVIGDFPCFGKVMGPDKDSTAL